MLAEEIQTEIQRELDAPIKLAVQGLIRRLTNSDTISGNTVQRVQATPDIGMTRALMASIAACFAQAWTE